MTIATQLTKNTVLPEECDGWVQQCGHSKFHPMKCSKLATEVPSRIQVFGPLPRNRCQVQVDAPWFIEATGKSRAEEPV